MKSMMMKVGAIAMMAFAGGALAQDAAMPTIEHQPVARATTGQPLTLNATIHSNNGVFQPVVAFRHTGEATWTKVPLLPSGGGIFTATLPGATVQSDLEYYLETYDNDGNGPARAGSPDAPFHVVVLAAAPQTRRIMARSGDASSVGAPVVTANVKKKSSLLSGRAIGGMVAGAVGLGGLGTGIAGWVLWNEEVQNSNKAPPSERGTYEGPITQDIVLGAVATGVGVVGLGIGIWLLVTGGSSSSSTPPADAPHDSMGGFSLAPVAGGALATYAARF